METTKNQIQNSNDFQKEDRELDSLLLAGLSPFNQQLRELLKGLDGVQLLCLSGEFGTETNLLREYIQKNFPNTVVAKSTDHSQCALHLHVPPLRMRKDDIVGYANFLLKEFSQKFEKTFTEISTTGIEALKHYAFPANLEELKSIIKRAVLVENGPILELSLFQSETLKASLSDSTEVFFDLTELKTKGLSQVRADKDENYTKTVLVRLLQKEDGNVSQVARTLKLDRANLIRLLKRFNIRQDLFRS
ncbi:MAG: hypothetical protein AB7F43_08830 [Bacteriovoracia bacterium]